MTIRFALAAVAVAALSTGCRSNKAGEGAEFDPLNPEDVALGGEGSGLFAPGEGMLPGGRFDQLPPVATPPGVYPVYFAYNDSAVPASESAKVGTVASFLTGNPGVVLVVEGNCDERGTNEYNMSLGEYRAQAVRDALAAQGVDGARIQTVSYGEERPANPGHNEAAWRENRRADFSFYQGN